MKKHILYALILLAAASNVQIAEAKVITEENIDQVPANIIAELIQKKPDHATVLIQKITKNNLQKIGAETLQILTQAEPKAMGQQINDIVASNVKLINGMQPGAFDAIIASTTEEAAKVLKRHQNLALIHKWQDTKKPDAKKPKKSIFSFKNPFASQPEENS